VIVAIELSDKGDGRDPCKGLSRIVSIRIPLPPNEILDLASSGTARIKDVLNSAVSVVAFDIEWRQRWSESTRRQGGGFV